MSIKGIIAQPDRLPRKCPFCYMELGMIEFLRRKTKKICKCRSCGRIIDERFLVR